MNILENVGEVFVIYICLDIYINELVSHCSVTEARNTVKLTDRMWAQIRLVSRISTRCCKKKLNGTTVGVRKDNMKISSY